MKDTQIPVGILIAIYMASMGERKVTCMLSYGISKFSPYKLNLSRGKQELI